MVRYLENVRAVPPELKHPLLNFGMDTPVLIWYVVGYKFMLSRQRHSVTLNLIIMALGDNAVEQAPAIQTPVPTSVTVTNPQPITRLVYIAGITEYEGTNFDKDFVLRFAERVEGLEAILLTRKQMRKLAKSINMSIDTPIDFIMFNNMVGNNESEVELSIERLLKGSTYTDKNGVIVVRSEAGVALFPQAIVLSKETRMLVLQSTVQVVSKKWTSSSKFAPKPATVENDDEE